MGRPVKNLLPALGDESLALAISIVWLLAVQLVAVLAWDADWLTRQEALMHWLVVGVLPPALALWSTPPTPEG
jgi:hypothetical protein